MLAEVAGSAVGAAMTLPAVSWDETWLPRTIDDSEASQHV
jgi:hypothetical protein